MERHQWKFTGQEMKGPPEQWQQRLLLLLYYNCSKNAYYFFLRKTHFVFLKKKKKVKILLLKRDAFWREREWMVGQGRCCAAALLNKGPCCRFPRLPSLPLPPSLPPFPPWPTPKKNKNKIEPVLSSLSVRSCTTRTVDLA